MLESPWLFDGIPVDLRTARQCHLEKFGCSLVGILTTAEGFLVGLGAGFHLVGEGFHVAAPSLVIEVLEQTLPLLVGIVTQAALVGASAIAPSGDLHPCVPFIEVFLGRSLA